MRVIIKPMGVVVLLAAIGTLTTVAFLRSNTAGVSAVPEVVAAPAATATSSNATVTSSNAGTSSPASILYDDDLRNGWERYGWAKEIIWTDTDQPRGGKGASITVRPQGYEAVYLHHPSCDVRNYDRITFYINGGPEGGQYVRVNMRAADKNTAELTLPPLAANKWTPVTLSLKDFWVSRRNDLTGFWIQSLSDKAAPEFYVDDVRLLKPGEPDPAADAK